MVSSVGNIVYSTNQGLYVKDIVDPEIIKWGKDYGRGTLLYDNFFLRDAMVYTAKISPKKPVTVACLSVIDPHTNSGIIGLLNNSSDGTVAGNEFKARFMKVINAELKKAGINAAIYDKQVEFVLVMDGNIDPKAMASIFKKAIDQIDPEFRTKINGRQQTIKFFEKDRMPLQVKSGQFTVDSACSAEEFMAVADKLFDLVKSRKFGPNDFRALLENIKLNEPNKLQKVDFIDANWKIVNKKWEHYKSAFHECMELLPDEFESKLRRSFENYGIEIDPKTKEFLLLKNRQLYVNELTGAFNKVASLKAIGKILAEKPANTWIAAGDIYNVSELNKVFGRAFTNNYLKTFYGTWKETAERFSVQMDRGRWGGDEFLFNIYDVDAEMIARMNMDSHKRMNAKYVLPDEILSTIPKNEHDMLVKSGLAKIGPNGELQGNNVKYGDLIRIYRKIKGVKTKGSQYSFYAKKISPSELRLDPEHFYEGLISQASKHANKVYSKTTVILKQDEGFVVLEPEGTVKYYSDYSMHKINPSRDNIEAAKKIIVDRDAKLISSKMPSENLKVETYKLPDGKEITVQTEFLKDRVEITTGDKLMKLKKPDNPVSSKINLNKELFKNADDVYKWIDDMKKQGWSDSRILGDAIKRLEDAGQVKYVAQVKLLNKLGRVVAPLGVAAMLYGIHMINEAPPEKRGELFAGFAAGLGTFMAGAQLGYKVIPGNPLWKAGGGMVLGTVFAVIGDAAVKSFIDSNPRIKEIFESKPMQAIAFAVQFTDPVYLYQTEKKFAEYKQKMKFVAEYGPEAWDEKVNDQSKPLKERLAAISEEINEPGSLVNGQAIDGNKIEKRFISIMKEYSKLASEIKELESQKYNIDPKLFRTKDAYLKTLYKVQNGAKTGSYNLAIEG